MANYSTSADLIDDVLWRTGELTSAGDRTSDMATWTLTYLNRVYQSICLGGGELVPDMYEDWWWLWKSPPGTVVLNPEWTTGTVTVTNNSTSGSFSTKPVDVNGSNISVQGWFLKVQGSSLGHQDVFRISSHVAGATAFTLDTIFTGTTSSGASFDAFQLEYQLGATDILRLISPLRQYRTSDPQYDVELIDAAAMDASYPLKLVESGTPTRAAVVAVTAAGLVTLRFNRWGGTANTDFVRLEYDYLQAPAALTDGTGTPLVPAFFRRVLSDWASFFILLDKNDDRAQTVGAMAKAGLRSMQLENKKKLDSAGRFRMGYITTRPNDWMRAQPLRTQSGLVIG